jgi:hypothetical protein
VQTHNVIDDAATRRGRPCLHWPFGETLAARGLTEKVGSITRGAQNLPGNWERRASNHGGDAQRCGIGTGLGNARLSKPAKTKRQ